MVRPHTTASQVAGRGGWWYGGAQQWDADDTGMAFCRPAGAQHVTFFSLPCRGPLGKHPRCFPAPAYAWALPGGRLGPAVLISRWLLIARKRCCRGHSQCAPGGGPGQTVGRTLGVRSLVEGTAKGKAYMRDGLSASCTCSHPRAACPLQGRQDTQHYGLCAE